MPTFSRILFVIGVLWTLPNTLIGTLIGVVGLCFGGRVRFGGEAIEFYGGGVKWLIQRFPNGQFILAFTLGHTVLGQTAASLDISREHEAVHVRQYERWGVFFLPAYFGSSFYMWMIGKDPYRDNPFEQEAYRIDDCDPND